MKCPWGQTCFSGYLQGGVPEAKERYDATELISRATGPVNILIDYVGVLACLLIRHLRLRSVPKGTADNFYKQGQLLPENFLEAARNAGYDEHSVRVRPQEGYDHSYYFVSYRRMCEYLH